MKKNCHFFLCISFAFITAFTKAQIGTNIDFGTGTISGWTYEEGINVNSSTMATASGYSASTNYSIMSTGATETNSAPIAMTSPLGGDFVRVGRPVGSAYVGRLSQTFTVQAGSTALNVAYATVLENSYHTCDENPYFYFTLKDASGQVIPGTSAYHTSNSTACSSSDVSLQTSGYFYYNSWTTSSFDLSAYVGASITIEVYGSGCTEGGHAGYCYFDAQTCTNSYTPNTFIANGISYPLLSSQNYLTICGSDSATVTAPSGAANYTWTGTGINGLTTPSVSITQAGVYQLVCDKPSPCSPTTAVTFTVGANPTLTITPSSTLVCAGTSIVIIASGAVSNTSYTWTPIPNTNLGGNEAYYTPTVTTTYTIIGQGSNGCIDTTTRQVNVWPTPTVAVTSNTILCSGSSATISVLGADSYTWSTGVHTSSIVVSPTVTTNYTVATKINSSGCVRTFSQTIAVYPTSITLSSYSPSVCPGSSVNITASGALSYTWSTGANTPSVSISPPGPSSYTVSGTNQCGVLTKTFTLTTKPTPTISVTGPDSLCYASSVTYSVSGIGVGAYNWHSYGNVSTSNGTGTSYSIGLLTPAPYTFTVNCVGAGTNGCSTSFTKPVKVLSQPTLSVSGPAVPCSVSASTLTASGASTYTWSTGDNTASTVVTPTTTTTYTVNGTGTNGCSASQTISVLTPPTISVSGPTVICGSANATLTASGANTYTWSTGANTNSITVSPSIATTYTVTGANSCGTATSSILVNVTPTPTLTVTGPDSLCYASSVTYTASGAPSYSWTSSGNVSTSSGTGTTYSIGLLNPAPYTFTVNCVGTGTNGCTANFTRQVKVLAPPTLSVGGPSLVCSGSPVTLVASGASTYTWVTGANTASIVVTPTVTTNYMVTGTGTNGCSSTYIKVVNVNANPLVLTPTTATICPGSSITMSATGASSYTWSTGVNSPSITESPTVTTTYTVAGYSTCTYTNSVIITVYQAPTINISGPDSLCLTNVVTFTATGTGTSYMWSSSGGFIGTSSGTGPSYSINLNTPAPYTFTVNCVATGTNGCTNSAVKQVKVLASPVITVSGPTVVCQYSTGTLLAGGANSYTWSTGANTASINVTPTVTTSYTVIGESSGCASNIDTVLLTVDNTCEDVWPGDANSDGTADNLDVLELGLHYTQTGPGRASVSNAWQSFYATDWTGTITNGQNLNHSDCNGDGIVDANDTLAIYNNYGLVHAFKMTNTTTANPQLSIVPDQPIIIAGTWGSSSIFLGDAATPINNINGIAFTINFDHTLVEAGNIYLEYPLSFLNTANQNLYFRKLDFNNGLIYTATTHTITNNVSGNGKIAILHYKIDPMLSQNAVLNISLLTANQSDAAGIVTPLTTGTTSLTVTGIPTGIDEADEGNTVIYPNPATNMLNITSSFGLQKAELTDVMGNLVLGEKLSGRNGQLQVSSLANGIYFIKVYSDNRVTRHQKIVVQK